MSVSLNPVPQASFSTKWRGFGGTIPTVSSVEFDTQLDKVALWLEKWDHQQRCTLIEKLLMESDIRQIQLVWTVIQPAMHRDFMYAAKKEFPSQTFMPISTHTTRELKRKTAAMRQDNYHRIGSAHLQHYNQVKDVNQELKVDENTTEVNKVKSEVNEEEVKDGDLELRLPNLSALADEEKQPSPQPKSQPRSPQGYWKSQGHWVAYPPVSRSLSQRSTSTRQQPTPRPLASLNRSFLSNTSLDLFRRPGNQHSNQPVQAAIFDGEMRSALTQLHTAPPCLRFIEMPSRRHIQDEESPRVREASNLSMYSLRERKRNKQNAKKPNSLIPSSNITKEGRQLIQWYIDKWDTQQRNEFLHKFLLKLDPRQHYFISSFLAIRQYRDFISLLSEDTALRILSFLHPFDIVRASKTSKTWHRLCNNNNLWRLKCLETKIDIPVEATTAENSSEPDWKRIFRENMFVKLNWQTGRCEIIDCKGHTDKVLCVTFDRKRLATGSQDRSIRLWSLKDGRCLQTLNGHHKGVWALQFFAKNLLVSGSYDATIKIWNLQEGSCLRTLLSHEGPVWTLALQDNLLVSGSQDRTAKVWDIGKCLLLLTLKGHNGAVFAVDMDPKCRLVFTGSADKTVRIWSAGSGRALRTLHVSTSTSVMAVSYSHAHLACCFANTICLYSINADQMINANMVEHQARTEEPRTKTRVVRFRKPKAEQAVVKDKPVKLVRLLQEHTLRIESLRLTVTGTKGGKVQGHIVSAGKDGELKYWDIAKGECIQTYQGSSKGINCIHCDETRIATASLNNKVKIYDFNTQ